MSNWTSLYLGKSENVQRRVRDHVTLGADKRTFGLKLHARKEKMAQHRFRVTYLCFDGFDGQQFVLTTLQREIRKRLHPIVGRQ